MKKESLGKQKSLGQKRRGDLELEDGSGRKRRLGGGRGVGLVACVVVEEGGEEIRVGGVLGGRGGQQKERRRGRECGDGSAGGERAAASEEVARERRRHFGGRRPAAAPEPGPVQTEDRGHSGGESNLRLCPPAPHANFPFASNFFPSTGGLVWFSDISNIGSILI